MVATLSLVNWYGIFESLVEVRMVLCVDFKFVVTAHIAVDCDVNVISHIIIHWISNNDLITFVQIAGLVLKVFKAWSLVGAWSRDEEVRISNIAQKVKSEFFDVLKIELWVKDAVVDVLTHLDSVSVSFAWFDVLNLFDDDLRYHESALSWSLSWWRIVDGEDVFACPSISAKIVIMLNFANVVQARRHILTSQVPERRYAFSKGYLLNKTWFTTSIQGRHATRGIISTINTKLEEYLEFGLVAFLSGPYWCLNVNDAIFIPELVLLVDQLDVVLLIEKECVLVLLVGPVDSIVITFLDEDFSRDSSVRLSTEVILPNFSLPSYSVFFADNYYLSRILDYCVHFDCARVFSWWFISSGDEEVSVSLEVAEAEENIVVDATDRVLEALEFTLVDHNVLVNATRNALSPCLGVGCDIESHVIDHNDNQVNVALFAPMVITLIHRDTDTVWQEVLGWLVLNDVELVI